MKENKIEQLTDIEHCLQRPNIYIGAITPTKVSTFILEKKSQKFSYEEIEYVPGFLKIIYEVIDNSVDEAIRTKFKYANQISVSIDQKTSLITVSDNGRGIPLTNMEGTDKSQLEVALTSLRAGSNFNDEEGRVLLGMNGVGASLTNIFSKTFVAEVNDGVRHGLLECADNLSTKSCVIKEIRRKSTADASKKVKTGTTISFVPDLKRFKLKKIDDIHLNLIFQRMMFLSYTYPEITFKFNGETIRFKNAKNFMSCFSDHFVSIQDENVPCKYLIGVIPNEHDEFTNKSYINGADCVLGGNHLDVIHSELVGRIKEKLSKKYPNIKVGDIKNRLSYIINFREFLNPMFNSQTKENFSSSAQEIKAFLKDVDWDAFAQKICKCQEIIEPIVESFKIKEELQNRKLLDKIGKSTPKFKCENFMPATEENKYCAICEGFSAQSGLSNALGRKQIGYFATRGVPLNTYEISVSKIAENKELTDIIKCLNLKLGSKEQNMTYENVLIATDADCFHESTYILTKHGNIQLKDIKYGDEVLTHTGEWKKVVDIIEKEKTTLIKIEINGEYLYMSENHQLPVLRDGKIEMVKAKDISLDNKLIEMKNPNEKSQEFINISSIERIECKPEKFIDINVEDDHSFFVYLKDNHTYILSHNCDGHHISELYIGFFSKYCPSIIKSGHLKKLMTPIICMKDGKGEIKEMFFTFDEYNTWLNKNKNTKLKTEYYKGLGSWKAQELKSLVEKHGLDKFIQTLEYDSKSVAVIDDWLSKLKADTRKEYLRKNEFSIFSI